MDSHINLPSFMHPPDLTFNPFKTEFSTPGERWKKQLSDVYFLLFRNEIE